MLRVNRSDSAAEISHVAATVSVERLAAFEIPLYRSDDADSSNFLLQNDALAHLNNGHSIYCLAPDSEDRLACKVMYF